MPIFPSEFIVSTRAYEQSSAWVLALRSMTTALPDTGVGGGVTSQEATSGNSHQSQEVLGS